MTRVRDDRNFITELLLVEILAGIVAVILFFLLSLIPLIGSIIGLFFAIPIVIGMVVYYFVYKCKMVRDINIVCAKTEGNNPENSWNYVLVSIVGYFTIGAYMMYWYYKQGGRLHKALDSYGIKSEETGVSYLLWRTVGSVSFGRQVSDYLLIQNLNKAARAYNEGGPRKGSIPEERNPIQVVVGGEEIDIEQKLGKNPVGSSGGDGVDPHTQKAAMLVGIKGQYAGQQIPITENDLIVMGRDGSQANLIFRSEKISKAHCKVQFMPNENCFYVVDTSTYGVFLENGKKLEKGQITKLSRGTKIVLGGTEVFQLK